MTCKLACKIVAHHVGGPPCRHIQPLAGLEFVDQFAQRFQPFERLGLVLLRHGQNQRIGDRHRHGQRLETVVGPRAGSGQQHFGRRRQRRTQ